jgi:hypothetical protein
MKVAFILSGLPDGLQCLDRNRQMVAETLNKYGWITRVETTFHSQASLQTIINEYKNLEIEDFIFFYTGHGDTSSNEGILTLRLHDGTKIDINTLHRDYFSALNIQRKAIVLDACYSGNFEGRKFHDKTEYLCSSDFDEESYEDNRADGLKQSYFSYYFCEAVEKLEGEITLSLINEHLKPKVDVQNSKYISIDSRIVIANKNYINIFNGLLEEPKIEPPSNPEQIFLIFRESDEQNIDYMVECYIHYEDVNKNIYKEYIFKNIHDKQEQELFIETIIDKYFEDVPIHFIVPEELLFINFKQWRYNDNELCNSYHIFLHHIHNYDSNIGKYSNMIKNWNKLYEKLKELTLSTALMRVDNNNKFNTKPIIEIEDKKIAKIGAYFNEIVFNYTNIRNILSTAKIGLWQYEQELLDDYQRWIKGAKYLENLKDDSRECDHMALLWDDMSLLEKLKRRK